MKTLKSVILLAGLLFAATPSHAGVAGTVPWSDGQHQGTPGGKVSLSLRKDRDAKENDAESNLQPVIVTVTNNSDKEYFVGRLSGKNRGVFAYSVVGAHRSLIYPPGMTSISFIPRALYVEAGTNMSMKANVPVNPYNKYKKMMVSLKLGIPDTSGPGLEIFSEVFTVGKLK